MAGLRASPLDIEKSRNSLLKAKLLFQTSGDFKASLMFKVRLDSTKELFCQNFEFDLAQMNAYVWSSTSK
jgi:hypothetical protein